MTITETPEAQEQAQTQEQVKRQPPPQTDETRAKARANQPTYRAQKVAELPVEERAKSAGRSDLYLNLLRPLTQDPGEWYEVVHFRTSGGAKQALNSIQTDDPEKRRAIPPGEWEFETRRVNAVNDDGTPMVDPTTGKQLRHSKLYARFLGNGST